MSQPLAPAPHVFATALCCAISVSAANGATAEPRRTYRLPAGDAATTLNQFASASGQQIVFMMDKVKGERTNAVAGDFTAHEALNLMLAGTGLEAARDPATGAFVVSRRRPDNSGKATSRTEATRAPPAAAGPPAAPAAPPTQSNTTSSVKSRNILTLFAAVLAAAFNADAQPSATPPKDETVQLGTFEVFGSKLVNVDIPRTRDDVQPYVVFSREQIKDSPALNLEDFFRARLPMNNGSPASPAQAGFGSTTSSINLRGLGDNQTLILLDGRRLPPRGFSSGTTGQADINGIPLGMIERIEILPSTASGIYGGGATGGVINIITRKDYSGVEATLTYQNSFKTDTAVRRIDLNGSFQLEGGKTMVTFNYGYSDANALLLQDRDFAARSRALFIRNNPAGVISAASPPQGHVPNIKSQSGSNLVLKSGTPLNSPITFVPVGYAGPASDAGAALVANAGKFDLGFANSAYGNYMRMYSTPTTEHYGLSLRRSFSSHVEAYVDASRSSNRAETWTDFSSAVSLPATAPTNPFTEAIRVTFPNLAPILDGQYFSNSARLAAGVVVRLPADWTAGADYVYSSSQFKSVTPAGLLGDPDGTGPGISYNTAVSSGVLNVVRDLYANPLNLTPYFMPSPYNISDGHLNANEWTLRASGPVWKLPAGPLALSASAQYRTEEVPGFVQTSRSPTTPTPTYRWSPRVNSHGLAYYVEARVPLIAAESRLPFVRALELQLSARQDDFTLRGRSDNSSLSLASPDGPFPAITLVDHKYRATKGTVGFKYVVTEDFALRASAGTGFLPPTLSQATPTAPSVQTVTFFDPKRGGSQTVTATLLQGGSPDVKPEESKSLSAGAVFTPKFIKGLRLSVDYTRITKTDEITTLTGPDLVALEAYFPGRVVRATLTPADQGRGYTGGVIQQIDTSSMNVTGKELEAWDVQADYSWKTASLGEFHAYSLATYQPHFRRKVTPQVDWLENAGYSGSPIKWRGNGGLDWKRGSWTVGWNAQYYDSYFIYSATASAPAQATAVLNQGSARFPSQIYHDLSVAYRWGAQPGGWLRLLANGQLTVVVQNVFNTSPPILATLDPLNPTNSYSNYGDPRLRRYSISLRKKF